jgi:hypothetical protein
MRPIFTKQSEPLEEGSQWSEKLTDALMECIEKSPDRYKNKLAQIYEDYMEKFGKQSNMRRIPPLLQDMFRAIEEGSDARVNRDQ